MSSFWQNLHNFQHKITFNYISRARGFDSTPIIQKSNEITCMFGTNLACSRQNRSNVSCTRTKKLSLKNIKCINSKWKHFCQHCKTISKKKDLIYILLNYKSMAWFASIQIKRTLSLSCWFYCVKLQKATFNSGIEVNRQKHSNTSNRNINHCGLECTSYSNYFPNQFWSMSYLYHFRQ